MFVLSLSSCLVRVLLVLMFNYFIIIECSVVYI